MLLSSNGNDSLEKRILITGGAGFIGSHLVDTYLSAGYIVGILDNLSTGNKKNIANKPIEFFEADIRNMEAIQPVFEQFRPSIVSHHAAQVSVRQSIDNPALDAAINVTGLVNVLQLCRDFGVKHFLFASSGGAIYGESPNHQPNTEETEKKPLSPYGLSKWLGEQYVEYFKDQYGLNRTIFRYTNVFGPRQDPAGEAGVITMFLERFAKAEPVVIYGDGKQVRDFIYVSDVVAANLKATETRQQGVYNVSSGKVTSVNELYESLAKAWHEGAGNPAPEAEHADTRPGEVLWSEVSTDKVRHDLAWQPEIDLKKGLEETVRWFVGDASSASWRKT